MARRILVTVKGRGATGQFESDTHVVTSAEDVNDSEPNGILEIQTAATPQEGPRKAKPARIITYAHGAWDRYTITEVGA